MSKPQNPSQANGAMEPPAEIELIIPQWPAPAQVRAVSTTRDGGVSQGGYRSLNLAMHVDDEPRAVQHNRRRLSRRLALAAEPVWLNQVHGNAIVCADEYLQGAEPPTADGAFATRAGKVCAVMTADCLPVLATNRKGDRVAAAHAGWRGLAAGVIEQSLEALGEAADELLVWLGPAIGPEAFEVGQEVREAFVSQLEATEGAFQATRPGHFLADIYQLARLRLAAIGVSRVYGGDFCTYQQDKQFFSFRRQPRCGRQASLIWLEES